MPSPNLTFAIILATLCGAAFHLILGGDARRLSIFILAGWLGFAIGQFVAITFNITLSLFTIGDLHIATALIGAFITLSIASLLTAPKNQRSTSR